MSAELVAHELAPQRAGHTSAAFTPPQSGNARDRGEGWGAKGEIKKKGKVIHEVEPLLKEMLRPNEKVLYLAKGV